MGPPTGASNAQGMENDNFRPIYRFISGMIEDTPIVTTECNYETVPKAFKLYNFQ